MAPPDEGMADGIGVAPGPANGFTLDLIRCLERFGDLLDWAMIIPNPFEPWPGPLVLPALARHNVRPSHGSWTTVGSFTATCSPGAPSRAHDHRTFRPAGWVGHGRERLDRLRPIAERHGLSSCSPAALDPLARRRWRASCRRSSRNPATRRGPSRTSSPTSPPSPAEPVLTPDELAELEAIGDNTGCMTLKGAAPDFEGDPLPDRWPLSADLAALAGRWGIDPARDLARA